MEPYTLSRTQRALYRGDRYLRTLEREQLKTVKEVTGALENAKNRLQRRQEWLKSLEEALMEEENSLRNLQAEFTSLLDDAINQAAKAKIRVEEEQQAVEEELQQMEVQNDSIAPEKPNPIIEEPQDIRIFVRPVTEEKPDESPETQVRVQWYHPGQSGFSL